MVRRLAGTALRQPGDLLVELRVPLDPDHVIPNLGLQHIEQCRDGKGGVRAKPAPRDRRPHRGRVAREHRIQDLLPPVGAVDVPGAERTSPRSPNWLKTNRGYRHFDWKWPFQAAPSCSPCTRLSELSMSSVIDFGGRRSCTASIQRPGRSAGAARFSGRVNTAVSNRPMALADAAPCFTDRPPTNCRITGSRQSRSASFTSS